MLKYVDKQQKGKLAKEMYDDNGIERPFSTMSNGLGADLFWSQAEQIKEKGTYFNIAGKERPCPQYYKNLIGGTTEKKLEKKIAQFKKEKQTIFEEKEFDDWIATTMEARERIMQDLELASGHAILRTPKPQTRGSVRGIMYSEMAKTWEQKADDFNQHIMQMLHEKMNIA